MKASLLTLGLYRSSGGPSKSVAAFQQALGADVISWVDPVAAAREPQIWEMSGCHAHVVEGSRAPILRQLCYPQAGGLADAERIIAASDVVSCHSFWRWHNIWIAKVAPRHGVPYWFVPHGALDPYVFQADRLAKRAFLLLGGRRFLDGAAAVVCATQREYDKLAPLMPKARPFIIPWPLDDTDFREQDHAHRTALRHSLGIPEVAPVVLYFGRLHPMKRPLETITAVAHCGNSNCHLLMLGNESGISFRECEARAAALGISDRVHMIGPVYGAERHRFLDAADIYISLSHRENFNFTAVECMASGMPVVLSHGNDLAHDLAQIPCGWMLPAATSADEALQEAVASPPSRWKTLGSAGRGWCHSHLRPETFQKRLSEFAMTITTAASRQN